MQPTTKLRFVEREIQIPVQGDFAVTYKTVRILQQWWMPEDADRTLRHFKSEWRDVPIEKE